MSTAEKPLTATLVAAAIQDLKQHAPFNVMSEPDLSWLASRLTVVYFAPEQVVMGPESGLPTHLHIIKSGAIAGFAPGDDANAAPWWRLSPGECFPLGALLGRRAVTSVYRSFADTFCYRMSAEDFRELVTRSAPFQRFATQRLANLLALARRSSGEERSKLAAQQPLERPLSDVVPSDVATCRETTSVRDALQAMRGGRADSVLIVDAQGACIGIFTLRDLRDRVALGGYDLDAPIADVMSRNPIALPAEAMAFDAAITMARHGFRHVVVTEGARAKGIVSEGDLFALQRVGLTALSAAIKNAADIDALAIGARDIRALVLDLMNQGTPSDQLTRIVSALNDLLTRRVVELAAEHAGVDMTRFCWLALGSEGRHEQTLATDQDNGIVFLPAHPEESESSRARLSSMAKQINDSLAHCGFPLCKGEIMASNPKWCLTESEWRDRFSEWMRVPNAEALLNSSIFFDFRPIAGAAELAARLRDWLTPQAKASSVFLRLMAENALRNEAPLGLLRDFSTDTHDGNDDTIDLKVNGVTLFIDAARVLALTAGVGLTNTVDRLRDAAELRRLNAHDVEGWVDAFYFLQGVRLNHQESLLRQGREPNNFLAPDSLNALERRILKESLRQARKLQERLRMDFRL